MRDAQSVQIDCIHAKLISFLVEENLFKALWLLSHGRSGHHEPTIANDSLPHILRCDALTAPERFATELVHGSHPGDTRGHFLANAKTLRRIICPINRVIGGEIVICELSRLTIELIN